MLRQGWNAYDRVGMLSTELEYNCTELECFRQCWNTFVESQNVMYRVGVLSTELEYLCTELEYLCTGLEQLCTALAYFLHGSNAF
jgi:hypothetical protein